MPEITKKQAPAHKAQRRKKNKESHNAVERHRKKKINAGINRIGELLPCSPALKQSKNMILDQALRYIIQLKQQNDILLLNGGDRVQAEEICRLRRQLEDLRKESAHYMELLKANGIRFLNDPTVHWKGKLCCAKVAKVTPTHIVPDGSVVYSSGNVVHSAAEDLFTPSLTLDVRKQQAETLIVQSQCDSGTEARPKLCQNGSLLQGSSTSSTPQVLLGTSLVPPVSMPHVTLVEQQPAKEHTVSTLAPSLSYIALQGPCPPHAAKSSTVQPASPPAPAPSLGAVTDQPASLSRSLPSFHAQAATANTLSLPRSVCNVSSRSVQSPAGASLAFRISTAGSTQTTWTTLQLDGTSQPVCHPALTPAPVPVPSPSVTSSSTSFSGLQGPTICSPVAQPSIQPVLAPPQVQAQSITSPIQPSPQPQSALLPVLQVVQVRSTLPPPVPAQTPNKPNVFFLQPVNPCQPPAIAGSSLPKQHIVIIQAANQNPVALASQGNTESVVVSANDQTSTSCAAAGVCSGVPTVGGKQLVHILPRPQVSMQASQTATVSRQVSLPAMKSPGGEAAHPTLQIVQPTTRKDPDINISLHSLGALANLNQSISNVPVQSLVQPSVATQPAQETVNCFPSTGLGKPSPSALAPMGDTLPIVLKKACVPPRNRRAGTKVCTGQKTISKRGRPTPQLNSKPPEMQTPDRMTQKGERSSLLPAEPAAASVQSSLASKATEPSHTNTDITVSSSMTRAVVNSICSAVVSPTICGVNSTITSVSCLNTSATSCTHSIATPTAFVDTSTGTGSMAINVASTISGSTAMNTSHKMTANAATCISSTMTGLTVGAVGSIDSSVSSKAFGSEVSCRGSTATTVRSTDTFPTARVVSSSETTPTSTSVSFRASGPTTSGVSITANCGSTTAQRMTASPQVVSVTTELIRPANHQNSLSASIAHITTPSSSISASPPVTSLPTPMPDCRRPPCHQHVPALSTTSAPDCTLMEAKSNKLSMERELGDVDMEAQTFPGKGSSSLQQECVLDQDALGSSSCGSSRAFSIASMLPMGPGGSTSSSAYGTFTFTSEQAEILALAARAFFEQDGPGTSKGGGCSSHTPTPAGWESPKPPQSSHCKSSSSESQAKLTNTPMGASLLVPLGVQPVVGSTSSPVGLKDPQSLSRTSSPRSLSETSLSRPKQLQPTQSQTRPTQALTTQSHSTPLQSSAVDSLSVNNLIKPLNSRLQPYTCSPSHAQQVSVPSPTTTAIPVTQSTAPMLPPCPEYTPLKNVLMRPHGTEHHLKDLSKRPAPDDTLLSSGKRSKTCLAPSMGQIDIKAAPPDHSQMMVSSASNSSSNSGGQGYPLDGHSGLVSGNGFISSVLKPEGQYVPQGPSHEQSHSQHIPHPSGHHLPMGNPYLKQQQHGQKHHLYQLQHHLTQPESARFHGINQRTLLQDQHSQKIQGLGQGGQPGVPLGQPQKVHHVDKSRDQQQHQQQSSHLRHLHFQHIQQHQFGTRPQEKCTEPQPVLPRALHGSHLGQERLASQNHGALQRLMSSRTLEQLTTQPGGPLSRPSDITRTPTREERNRISSYSAEALIGKSPSSINQSMGLPLQAAHATQVQTNLHTYLDTSRGKAIAGQNVQGHSGPLNVKHSSAGQQQQQQLGTFEVQASRGSDMNLKPAPSSHRGLQTQGVRMGLGSGVERQSRGVFPGGQGVSMGVGQREHESCRQSFMQSLLPPHLSEQVDHQNVAQCCPQVGMEYSCGSSGSSTDLQAKAGSPSVASSQKTTNMLISEGSKSHHNPQVSASMRVPGVCRGLPPHPSTQSNAEPGCTPARPMSSVSQRARHPVQDVQGAKVRPGDRGRSGTLRSGNSFEPDGHLSLPAGGGMLLRRQQMGGEAKRGSIVRFMADGGQVTEDNLVSDQHLTQNFGFPFIPEGGMNPPSINANPSFIPPVTQPSTPRTPAILPVEHQNTLPSFYPSYSPAAHPSLPSEIPLQYFSNQMFTSPSTDKSSSTPRFGSILSPPRPVGFTQPSFPLLSDMPPMPIANSSGITPHLSSFNLTSLFPEIAAAMPSDGTSMPMSPLLSLTNTPSADSSKQSNRPAHNISHILGHDGSSAV